MNNNNILTCLIVKCTFIFIEVKEIKNKTNYRIYKTMRFARLSRLQVIKADLIKKLPIDFQH